MRILTVVWMAVICAVADPAAQPAGSRTKPAVWVLSTGGTIAGQGSSTTDLSNYKPGSILGEQLVRAVPQIAEIADVKVEQVVNIASHDLTLDNWLALAGRIRRIIAGARAVAGVVIKDGSGRA